MSFHPCQCWVLLADPVGEFSERPGGCHPDAHGHAHVAHDRQADVAGHRVKVLGIPHATQGARITRKSLPLGNRKWSNETVCVCIVTSLAPSRGKPELIGTLIRGHWGLEKGLRYRRDVPWREDSGQN